MPHSHSKRKRIIDAGLKTLLATVDTTWWLKAPATFVSELASRFGDLAEDHQDALTDATPEQLQEALLRLNLAAQHAATAAAGIARIEDQVSALQEAIRAGQTPPILKFPGPNVTQNVTGNGNIVAARDVKIDMRRTSKHSPTRVIPGTVATEPFRIGYLQYLARRFNEFRAWHAGKKNMKCGFIHGAYRRAIKFSIATTPLDLFDEAVGFLQERIRNTKLGRIEARRGNRLFEEFEEYVARTNQAVRPQP